MTDRRSMRAELKASADTAAAVATATRNALATYDAWINASPPPTPTPTPTPTPGTMLPLKRAGRLLTLANGARWTGAGTNLYLDSYGGDPEMKATSDWEVANAPRLADELAAAGVNLVRIPTNNDRSVGTYIARLKTVTDAFAAKGIRTILCPFGGVTWAPSAANGNLVADQWAALGKGPHLLIETVNEPNPQSYADSPAAWLEGNRAEIAAIRAKGYTQPILVACRNWCWTLPVAEARILNAADNQLVFTSHRYGFDGNSNRTAADAQAWVAEWSQAADLCVGVTETGWYNNGGDRNGLDPWLRAVSAAHVTAAATWLAFAVSWILKWDAGEQISARSFPLPWNSWGQITRAEWAGIRALVP